MDTMPPLYVSPMLREAASLKVEEFNRAKNDFKRLYHLHSGRPNGADLRTQLKDLFEYVIKIDPSVEHDDDSEIISRYFKHADDRSISQTKLLKIQQALLGRLRKHFCRLECSSVHVQLMNEVIAPCDSTVSTASKLASVDLEDDFEVVDSHEPNQVLEKFEKEAFATDDVEIDAIEAYMGGLGVQLSLREQEIDAGEESIPEDMEIGQDFMMWCVADLLRNDLISEDKKRTLSEYLQSPIALKELTSIINAKPMRLWNYKDAEKGLPVTIRQDAKGQPCVVIEEGIVDMLFLHCVGIGFAMKLRGCLDGCAGYSKVFDLPYLTIEESNKREFFLGRHPMKMMPPMPPANICSMCHPFPPQSYPPVPMPPPPPVVEVCPPPLPVVEICPPPPPPPPPGFLGSWPRKRAGKVKLGYGWQNRPNLESVRQQKYLRDFFVSRLPEEDGCSPTVTSMEEVQAKLIRTLVAERELRKAFDGEVSIGSVKFNTLTSSLPHKTILAVLRFLELPEAFIELSKRFLSAKLNIGPAVRGGLDRVLPRARGVPEGHALELFFTEAVMCFLELSVRQSTGTYLYRLKDRCYFIGNNEQYLAFEEEVAKFADVMGLDIDFERTQSIGLLTLADGSISINGPEADEYAKSIKKQLDACTTVLDWVRVWNSTIGTYAAHLFGPLSKIMGKQHLHAVKNTYKIMFDIILGNRDLTAHITALLSKHIKVDSAVAIEPLIYLPQAYGGLGVKNPFIALALAHEMPEDPLKEIENFLSSEEAYYKAAVTNYAVLDAEGRARKLESIFENDQTRIDAALGPDRDLSVFMSKEELIAHRERAGYPTLPIPPYPAVWSPIAVPSLTGVYDSLMLEVSDDISCSNKILDEVRRLSGKGDMKTYRRLSEEDKWVLQLYGGECFETYGGLEIWCGESVPQEVLRVVRGGAELYDDDDDSCSTVSYMTEP